MKYLLDTNAVIGLLNADLRIIQRIEQHRPGDFALSSIVLHELFFGAYKARRTSQNLLRIEGLPIVSLEFDKEDAREAGEIRAKLASTGTPIGPYDVLIAGQARARNLIVVTNNVREFSRVPGLSVEDWQSH